ncbi:hypothetical protein A0256_22650 [Mucilaginibacter sp. PAMC 26640]|nr:hypothetical protein A0256_22650 [Mucilaginibacter sp. PAMC 26640]
MLNADHILANADDFGLNPSVNKAIAFCFQQGYINSASLLTNTPGFDEAVQMIKQHVYIKNIGVHINFAEGKPLTPVHAGLLTANGNWNLKVTGKAGIILSKSQKVDLKNELFAQINKALSQGVAINHIDSHYHLHTLPGLFNIFLDAAKYFNLKLRLAQTYREKSYLKFWYRMYINNRIITACLNYTYRFETVAFFLANQQHKTSKSITEVMLHPSFDEHGILTDHYDADTMVNWINYIRATV